MGEAGEKTAVVAMGSCGFTLEVGGRVGSDGGLV